MVGTGKAQSFETNSFRVNAFCVQSGISLGFVRRLFIVLASSSSSSMLKCKPPPRSTMPSPPPSTLLHGSFTLGTEVCFQSRSEFLFVLHAKVSHLFDFVYWFTRGFEERMKNILPLWRRRKEALGGLTSGGVARWD